jgi:hypothetical protein
MLILSALHALAQDAPAASLAPKARRFDMEVNFRGRYLSLPGSILDIWYFDGDGAVPERPRIAAYSLGMEYVIKQKPDDGSSNGIFYVEYIGGLMTDGYFDDRENPPNHSDGSYLVNDAIGLVTVGADYAFELRAKPWLSFLFGGGLGIGFATGQLTEWEAGSPEVDAETGEVVGNSTCDTAPAYDRYDMDCPNDGPVAIPPVLPVVDINIGVRFTVNERATIRLEGGLHDLLYGGAAVGVMF